MRRKVFVIATSGALLVALVAAGVFAFGTRGASASQTTYDINTLAGKVASVHGTAGLQIRFSAFIEEEAEAEASPTPTRLRSARHSCCRARWMAAASPRPT